MQSTSRTKKNGSIANDRTSEDDLHGNNSGVTSREIRVLIVEDHPALRQSLAMFLEFHGYTVTTASGFTQALALARSVQPNVAVCDRQLNESQDGIDVARALQQEFGTRLVFVSGTSMHQLRAETVDLDVMAYIKKPALPNQIEAAVRLAAENRP